MSDLLHAHLALVSRRDLRLARRLDLPAATDGFGTAEGQPARRVGLAWRPASVSEALAQGLVAEVPAEGDLLILGAGVGTLTRAALDRWPRRRIFLLSPTPCEQNALTDGRTAGLDAGRLVLCLASDLIALSPWQGPILTHPLAAELHTRELRFLRRPAEHPVALIRHGALFVDDLIDELEERGLRVAPLAFERLAEEEVQRFVTLAQPHSLWSVNVHDLCDFAAARGSRCSSGDRPTLLRPSPPKRPPAPHDLCTWRQAHVATWWRAGFPHVCTCRSRPTPSPAARRAGHPQPHGAVSFVGASMAERPRSGSRGRARCPSAGIDPTVAGTLLGQLSSSGASHPASSRCWTGWRRDFATGRGPDLLMVGEWAAAGADSTSWPGWTPRRAGLGRCRVGAAVGQGVDWQGMLSHHAPLSRVYSGSTVHVDLGRSTSRHRHHAGVRRAGLWGCLLAERSPERRRSSRRSTSTGGPPPTSGGERRAGWRIRPGRALARGRAHVLAHHGRAPGGRHAVLRGGAGPPPRP